MKKNNKAKFITFEGMDGSGKSTIIKKLVEKLQLEGFVVESSREPGGNNVVCEEIREILLTKPYEVCYETEALLFAASRTQHVKKYIEPKLAAGVSVIVDRFLDSSIAFQGYGRKLGSKEVLAINEFGIGKLRPDLTIFLDVPMDLGFERIFGNRAMEINKLDRDSLAMKNLIYDGYKKIIKENKKRIVVIDASQPLEVVLEKTYEIVKRTLQ